MRVFAICLTLLAAAAGVANAVNLLSDPALSNVRLTTDRVKRVIQATRAMQASAKTDREFQREYSSEEPPSATLEETIQGLAAKRPRHVALIRSAGLTTKEYLTIVLSLLQADAVQRHEMEAASLRGSLNPDNLAFVRRNTGLVRSAMHEIELLNEIKERKGAH